jgi:hypothetical protein
MSQTHYPSQEWKKRNEELDSLVGRNLDTDKRDFPSSTLFQPQ